VHAVDVETINSWEDAMALWTKLRTELDRAGRVAQNAFDEGRLRLEALRARQLADRAAQALGYAMYRARADGGDIAPDLYASLSATLAAHEAEVASLEAKLKEARTDD
jgi:hypothetical protein